MKFSKEIQRSSNICGQMVSLKARTCNISITTPESKVINWLRKPVDMMALNWKSYEQENSNKVGLDVGKGYNEVVCIIGFSSTTEQARTFMSASSLCNVKSHRNMQDIVVDRS